MVPVLLCLAKIKVVSMVVVCIMEWRGVCVLQICSPVKIELEKLSGDVLARQIEIDHFPE